MTELDDALAASRRDEIPASEYYALLVRSDVYVPLHDDSDAAEDEEAGFGDDFDIFSFSFEDGEVIPVFDTEERVRRWTEGRLEYVNLTVLQLLRLVDASLHVVLNPGTDSFKLFTPDELGWIRERIDAAVDSEAAQDD